MPLIQVNNTRLFVDEIGSGPTIVFLHGGFGLDSSYFRPYLDPLSQWFHCLFVDLRGNGRSDEVEATSITLPNILKDLEALRAHYQLGSWVIMGHSGGGLVSQLYGLRYPHSLRKLIIMSSFGQIPFDAPDWREGPKRFDLPQATRGFNTFLKGVATDDEYRKANLDIAPLFFADPEKADLTPFMHIQYRVAPFNQLFNTHGKTNLLPDLPKLAMPLLAIHGREDWRVPVAEAERVVDLVPDGNLLVLGNAGHFPFFEQSQECVVAIRDFAQES